jgi:hypothetical protein
MKREQGFLSRRLAVPAALIAAAISWTAASSASAQTGVSKEDGIAAFETVKTVLQHPRCQNCHIPGDAPLQFDDGRVHAQEVQRGLDGKGAPGLPCATARAHCAESAAPARSAPSWLPPAGRWFYQPDSGDLCRRCG